MKSDLNVFRGAMRRATDGLKLAHHEGECMIVASEF